MEINNKYGYVRISSKSPHFKCNLFNFNTFYKDSIGVMPWFKSKVFNCFNGFFFKILNPLIHFLVKTTTIPQQPKLASINPSNNISICTSCLKVRLISVRFFLLIKTNGIGPLLLTNEPISSAGINAPIVAFVGISAVFVINPAVEKTKATVATRSGCPGIPCDVGRKSAPNFEFATIGIRIEGTIVLPTALAAK